MYRRSFIGVVINFLLSSLPLPFSRNKSRKLAAKMATSIPIKPILPMAIGLQIRLQLNVSDITNIKFNNNFYTEVVCLH